MQGAANYRGHPYHFMFIPFPVAFWTGALFTDLGGAVSHDQFWFRMSVALIGMGNVGAIFAAVAGYIDYRTAPMSRKARSLATGHLQWSLGTLAIFPLAFLLRFQEPASRAGIVLTVLGSVVLFVGGFLGSELTNRHRVGVLEEVRTEA